MTLERPVHCAMTVLAGPSDVDYFRPIVAHLKKTAGFAFSSVVLVLDTMPSPRHPKGSASTARLISTAGIMQQTGEIDRYVSIGDQYPTQHFAEVPRRARDHRGIPMFGWIAGFEAVDADYLFHADCDILVHTEPGYSWVEQAIALAERDSSVMFIAPRPGPPTASGAIFDQGPPPVVDPDGNFRFKWFSSRRYVVKRSRFRNLIPLDPQHKSTKRKLLMRLGGSSSLLPWETHVAHALRKSPYWRVMMSDPRGWSLHAGNHGAAWKEHHSSIINAVEQGRFPPKQAGHYDLMLSEWIGGS